MDDRSDLTTTASGLVVPATRGISRRRVVGTAAWAAPAIVVAGAVPAFAASPGSSAAYNTASFRYNSNAELTAGTPNSSGAGIAVSMTIMPGAPVTGLQCVLTQSGNGVSLASNSVTGNRNGVTWAIANGDLATDGWSSSPAIGAAQSSTITFSRGGVSTGTIRLQCVLGSVANADFPLTFTFSATGMTTRAVTVSTSATSPFITGAAA